MPLTILILSFYVHALTSFLPWFRACSYLTNGQGDTSSQAKDRYLKGNDSNHTKEGRRVAADDGGTLADSKRNFGRLYSSSISFS